MFLESVKHDCHGFDKTNSKIPYLNLNSGIV